MSFIPQFFATIPFVDDDDDMKYILQAEFDGRLKSDEGFLSATGDLATLTAESGKDLFLTAATVVFFTNTTPNVSTADEVVLKINGTIVETAKYSSAVSSGSGIGGLAAFRYEFKNIGHKVAATQIIKLEVITISSVVDVEGFVQAIEVPTGENPTTYTGS